MGDTTIEWADKSWNPMSGCSKVSPGCAHCYAERMAKRLAGRCGYPADNPFQVTLHPERLEEPLRWQKPSRIFVCSMGDLFHPLVPWAFTLDVWRIMEKCPQHQFMVLTKRPERMRLRVRDLVTWPNLPGILPNVWLGVTAENQQMADERIPLLLATPAAKRFVSIEPMLGPVGLTRIQSNKHTVLNALDGCGHYSGPGLSGQMLPSFLCNKLDLVILGGETGPGARPMHPDWARRVRDDCIEAGVPFFLKQHGEYLHESQLVRPHELWMYEKARPHLFDGHDGAYIKVGKRAAGRLLDGREWNGDLEGEP